MLIYQLTLHNEYIEDSAVVAVVYYPAVIEYLDMRTVLSHKCETYIIIGICIIRVDLSPDAFFDILLLRFLDKLTEAASRICKKFFHIIAARKFDHFIVCRQKFVIIGIRLIDKEGPGKVCRNILECKAKLSPYLIMTVLIYDESVFSSQLNLIQRHIRISQELFSCPRLLRIFRVSERYGKAMLLIFCLKIRDYALRSRSLPALNQTVPA